MPINPLKHSKAFPQVATADLIKEDLLPKMYGQINHTLYNGLGIYHVHNLASDEMVDEVKECYAEVGWDVLDDNKEGYVRRLIFTFSKNKKGSISSITSEAVKKGDSNSITVKN